MCFIYPHLYTTNVFRSDEAAGGRGGAHFQGQYCRNPRYLGENTGDFSFDVICNLPLYFFFVKGDVPFSSVYTFSAHISRLYTISRPNTVHITLNTSVHTLCSNTPSLPHTQPNMHAAERYEGVVDKLRECNDHLEDTRDTARELGVRFEEVKKQRQTLFQVGNYCFSCCWVLLMLLLLCVIVVCMASIQLELVSA